VFPKASLSYTSREKQKFTKTPLQSEKPMFYSLSLEKIDRELK